jgi:cytochrome P450
VTNRTRQSSDSSTAPAPANAARRPVPHHQYMADAPPPQRTGTGGTPDWATDFDHADPAYNENAPAVWAELRERCPVAHTARYGGAWLPVRYDDIRKIAYDTTHFSSVGVVVSNGRPIEGERGIGTAPPITSDPPFHASTRKLLLPAFAPKAIEPWEPEVRSLCRSLIADIAAGAGDVIDAATQYAQHIPVHVIARMLGFPLEDADRFRGFVHDILEAVDVPIEQRIASFTHLKEYIGAHIDDHETNPRDDLTSQLLALEVDGEPITRQHVGGTIVLLLVAGIDTTWSAIGSALWHLAQHPDDLARLVQEPDLIPTACEELLRAYAPVTMARLVVDDTEVGGCPVKAGEWMLLPFPAANRDPAMFTDPDVVRIDRDVNRHAAFGLGIHRCIGSNLARLELRVAVEEFIRAYPQFTLEDPDDVTWSVGQVRGPRRCAVRIGT